MCKKKKNVNKTSNITWTQFNSLKSAKSRNNAEENINCRQFTEMSQAHLNTIMNSRLFSLPLQSQSVCKVSSVEKKKSNLHHFFDRKWNNWKPLRLITRVARTPKDGSSCPSSFMSELWKRSLPLDTSFYAMQRLEVPRLALIVDPTLPWNLYLLTTVVSMCLPCRGEKLWQIGYLIVQHRSFLSITQVAYV